jgi:heterodisulfide reductase subunit A
MRSLGGMEHIALVKKFKLLCAKEGKELIKNDIKEYGLTRIVIAACSPKEHEHTFKNVVVEAGMNPFFLQIANIREQCAWVVKDKILATRNAKILIRAAVKRVMYQEALEIKEIDCQPDVLVIGAGISGISAALTLAQKHRKVYLLEKSAVIGGNAVRYEAVFPGLECASCMLEPKLDEVLHNTHIEVITLGRVQEVLGYYGNFTIKIKKEARHIDATTCIGCGACVEVCPVKVRNEYSEGLDERKAVYIPYPGALPHLAVIDEEHCAHFTPGGCNACQGACPLGSIDYQEAGRVLELKVGAVILATGFDMFDSGKAPQYGYGKIDNVYTGLEFERLLSPTGPTAGRIILRNGKPPERIALIHCVGSRTLAHHGHCSAVCCAYALKFAQLIRKKLPDTVVLELYSDFCLPGKELPHFFNTASGDNKIEFHRMHYSGSVEVLTEQGKIVIMYTEAGGARGKIVSDMVVLASAMEGSKGAESLAECFDITTDKAGFFNEAHATLASVSTAIEGVYIAGCAQAPCDIRNAVAGGQAAAGMVLSRLLPGEKLTLDPQIAVLNEEMCSGCKLCMNVCPFGAIHFDERKKQCGIHEVLCKGCGVCSVACPVNAIETKHFTDTQISAEIKGLLE